MGTCGANPSATNALLSIAIVSASTWTTFSSNAPTQPRACDRIARCPRLTCSPLLTRSESVSAAKLRSEEHTSELQSRGHLVCRLLLEKKNIHTGHRRPGLCLALDPTTTRTGRS